jgi:hypothetical protein
LPIADVLALVGIVISVIALGLSVYVYQWSSKDLKEFRSSTQDSIQRWSDVTMRVEGATSRIEKAIEMFTRDTFALVREHVIRGSERAGGSAIDRGAQLTQELVKEIQKQSRHDIEEILSKHGIAADNAPGLRKQLSAMVDSGLLRSTGISERVRDTTLREDLLRTVEDHADQELTLADLEALLSASYARSDIATTIESLRDAGSIVLTPNMLHPDSKIALAAIR